MTAQCRIALPEYPESPKESRRAADAFRGRFIDKCAIVEQWAVTTLEEVGHKTRSTHLFGQKLRAIRELAGAETSAFKTPQRVVDLLDCFQAFVSMRSLLAHAIQKTVRTEGGTDLVIFTPVRGFTTDWLSLVLSKDDMTRLLQELGRLAKELTDQRLKDVSPSSPPPPAPGAAAGP